MGLLGRISVPQTAIRKLLKIRRWLTEPLEIGKR